MKIGFGGFKCKNKVLTKWCIEDPKSNVLDLSKESTEVFLRPSMLEELGGHGHELGCR